MLNRLALLSIHEKGLDKNQFVLLCVDANSKHAKSLGLVTDAMQLPVFEEKEVAQYLCASVDVDLCLQILSASFPRIREGFESVPDSNFIKCFVLDDFNISLFGVEPITQH
jgi:hypothetical protein